VAADWLGEYVAALGREGISVQVATTAFGAKRISGTLGGAAFEYRIGAMGPPQVFNTRLSIESGAPGEFLVEPQHPGCSIAKSMGMVKEFQAGERQLDEDFYFAGTTDAFAREVFGLRENLDVVRALLAAGFGTLRKLGGRIIAARTGRELLSPANLKSGVALLARLKLPQAAPGSRARNLADRLMLHLLRAVLIALPVVSLWGVLGSNPLAGGWVRFYFFSLPFTVLLCALLLGAAYLLFGGRPMVAASAVGWTVFFFPLLLLIGCGTIALVNERLDFSAPKTYEVREVRRYVLNTRRSASDTLVVESWRGPDTEALTSDGFLSGGFGSSLSGLWRVRVRSGLLGFQWIESIEPVNPKPALRRKET
jgi:hypothetical protein